MGDFTLVDGAGLIGFNRHHCRRVAIQRGKFHFLSRAIGVNMHHGPHVAGFQSVGRQVGFQNDAIMLFNHIAFHA